MQKGRLSRGEPAFLQLGKEPRQYAVREERAVLPEPCVYGKGSSPCGLKPRAASP